MVSHSRSRIQDVLLQRAILHTLSYSAIFHYPLTKEEIIKYLLLESSSDTEQILNQKVLTDVLEFLVKTKKIYFQDIYYVLPGKIDTIALRKKRKKISERKHFYAKQYIRLFAWIPTIACIGLSGSVAVENAEDDADIDICIITYPGTMWTTRFLVMLIVKLWGLARNPQKHEQQNLLCLNMFMDGNALSLPQKKQNLFTAHEVAQMQPLVDKSNTYNMFLHANQWIKRYLPNSIKHTALLSIRKNNIDIFFLFEKITKTIQLWYMHNKRTTEVITDTLLAFHPQDNTTWVINRYHAILKQYEI